MLGFARFPQGLYDSDKAFRHSNLGAGEAVCIECAMYFCVNDYNVSSRNGKQSVEMISSWRNVTGQDSVDMTYLSPPNPLDIASRLKTFAANARPLSQYFISQLTAPHNDLRVQVSLSSNVTDMMANLSTSMSFALMNMNLGNGSVAVGVSWEMTSHIRVHWLWLLLSISLVLMSAAFLTQIILLNHKRQSDVPGLWKSSILGPILHDMIYAQREMKERPLDCIGEMEEAATEINVRLEKIGARWGFVEE